MAQHALTASFKNFADAQEAIIALGNAGFSQDQISILLTNTTPGYSFDIEANSKAPEGAVTGALAGGVLGAVITGVAAISSLAIPGIGIFGSGPVVASLAGAGAGSAAGGFIGAMAGFGVSEYEATLRYNELKEGAALIAVHVKNKKEERAAWRIFKSEDAYFISDKIAG